MVTAENGATRLPRTTDESAGRSRRRGRPRRRGTSGLHRAGWSSTATRGDPRDSATENKPPALALVRVKRRCKRPPHTGGPVWLRKTPPEQRQKGRRAPPR